MKFAFALPTFVSVALAIAIPAAAALRPQVVTVTASTTTLFAPAEITVHAGQPVELVLVGQIGVHGIQSSDLGIPQTVITPGSTNKVTFTPTKPGTYTVHCTIPCGPNHTNMTLVIKVT